MGDAIVLEGLRKRFGDTTALDGFDLVVPEATVVGLLGPNGAGKTTAVRIVSTLLRPDGGSAKVFGADVVSQANRVRACIGLTGQFSAVDEILTGAENLRLAGRLHRLGAREAHSRAEQLLAVFDLTEAANRQVKTYSGGMRRRLDLAASLMARPRLLILDEPTTGLDSRSRMAMWDVIAELRSAGTTVLLTTQYLEEADRLADSIAVIDRGRLVASGTASELKAQVGGEHLELVLADRADRDAALEVLAGFGAESADTEQNHAAVTVDLANRSLDDLPDMLIALRKRSIGVADVAVRRPTLDSVFLRLTGHPASTDDSEDKAGGGPANSSERTSRRGADAKREAVTAGSREG
ncbi:ATP-binding cassette domain-containing protein [Dactylosporangium sp. NPDC000555]|uniref:ATP-binding cassette domain-containing protein n=1 Tax=Dactylosporangium sp. NPDC000555 TaxID=3154260 RepID=UPI00332BB28A